MGSFRYFDHTADVGMEVSAATLEDLLATACRGWMTLIVPEETTIQVQQRRRIEVANDQPDLLLFDLLNELMYLFESERFVFRDIQLSMPAADRAVAELGGETLEAARHQPEHEIKAVTYHELSVVATTQGWQARVIFDI